MLSDTKVTTSNIMLSDIKVTTSNIPQPRCSIFHVLILMTTFRAVPYLRWPVAGISYQTTGFNPRSIYVRFVVGKEALRQVSLRVFWFFSPRHRSTNVPYLCIYLRRYIISTNDCHQILRSKIRYLI
jgi:hypothetical protein